MLAEAATDVIIDLRRLSQGTMPLAITETNISLLPEGTSPPTYFETNKFTSVFQGIVSSFCSFLTLSLLYLKEREVVFVPSPSFGI